MAKRIDRGVKGAGVIKIVSPNKAGFTLVEVLVATSILAMSATMVFGAFNSTLNSGQGSRERAEILHTTRFIVRKLTEDLQGASLLSNNKRGHFVGIDSEEDERQADEIRFTGFAYRTLLVGTGSDQSAIAWFVEKSDNADELYSLYRQENRLITTRKGRNNRTGSIKITDRLVSFNVRYFSRNKFTDSFIVRNRPVLPDAVEVTFTLEDNVGVQTTHTLLSAVGGSK